MQEEKIKFYGLSWVIELHFKDADEAKAFLKLENFDVQISGKQKNAVVRIED